MLKYLLLLTILSLSITFAQAQSFLLNEKYLDEQAQKGAPRLDEIEAALLSAQSRQGEADEEFIPEVFGRGSYTETNERALIRFQPIFTPVARAQLGVRQNLKHGLTAQAAVTTDQRSAQSFVGTFRDSTITVLSFTMQLDLWKDLFGRLSKAKLQFAELESRSALIQKEIQTKAYKIALRRLYWSLVANEEGIKISEELLKTSQTQANEASARFKNAVADADEVARYQAQVSLRQGSILHLKYQREVLLRQLRNLLPQLGVAEVTLGKYDLPKTIEEVLACTVTIAQENGIPYQNTKYDEVVGLLRKMRENRKTFNSRYSDVDVKLFGTAHATGVGSEEVATNFNRGSFGASINDIESTNRTGYEVGLLFTMPLGDVKNETQRTKELYDEKRLLASINNTDAQVINTHVEVVKSIAILKDVIKTQRLTSIHLGKRLVGMKRKYQQARVSVNDLIMDQDALFNSELTTINTQLQMLNTLFDYLMVFTETPCSFNRI